MSKKIGRNDPCPCGSGKKYKHCCMRVEQSKDSTASQGRAPLQSSGLDAPKIKAYLESHKVTPILDYLIALQLNPANNGKNLRFEHIGQLAISSVGKANATPDLRAFKRLIDEEYPYDMMEDIPMNMFCETVVFHGGNYMFFSGLSTHCSELFRAMTESIYRVDGIFQEEFKAEIYQGVTLMLELGNAIATRAGIGRMTRGGDNPREKIVESLSNQSYAIPEAMMDYLIRFNRLDEHILDNFLLDKEDPEILTTNPERNPILYRPIVETEGAYYFIGISNQGCAINNFILKTAAKYNCTNELVELTQETVWNRIGMSCMNLIHWAPIEFEGFLVDDAHYKECLFRIDVNWVAYLCYAKDTANDISVDGVEKSIHWNMDTRLKQTLAAIRSNEKTKGFHILTLVVYSSMGEPFGLMMNEQTDTDYLLHFSAFDFMQLVQTEKWDNMSLVRYARTKENTPALKYGFNQPLDVYSLYKHKGESFYFSDERKPDFMQIEPNEGCDLIHKSKEDLNFHGTPMHFDGKRVAYIPVQRDMDYASIYKPINESMSAKCCESYPIPIWVRCSQDEKEGENPSSISETVITAIAFWMDRLRTAIEERVVERFKGSVQIDLAFDEKTLSDKYIHHDLTQPLTDGIMNVSKTDTGVTVEFDQDFIRGFLGSDNAHERLMVKVIVTCLIGLKEENVQTILDKLMPLGQAKMILMMEASNSPISFPMWLNPPIYIHPASSQMMLDLFPKWMKEKGFDITGRLVTVKQKDDFLHNGVDVLLEKLYEQVDRFESHSLLKRLISNHETLLYQREHNKMLHPAQILCFGDNEEKRNEFFETERRLSESGLATRALIEYVAATQGGVGSEQAGSDDIEGLLSIMSEITHIGGICDAVHLGVSDHTIEKLASGRYGIYDDDFNNSVGGFASARSVEAINSQVEDFEDKMEHLANLQHNEGKERDSKFDEIDEAFSNDWGVSYAALLQLLYSCYILAMKLKKSVLDMPEKKFMDTIIEICPELSEGTITKCMSHLALDKRADYLTPPNGMDWKEVLPWIYNRELSYLRRPIVKWEMPDGEIHIMCGFRSCLTAGMQLTDLLYSGRLKNVGKKLGKLLGKFEAAKGVAFNEEVRKWLKHNTSLQVWDFDVPMKPKSAFATPEDYGDIDVMAYDSSKNVVYSIECKNTNTAKNVREMKKEMDDYLGRGDNPEKDKKKALVLKHLRRHQWLKNNMDQVKNYLGVADEPIIKSMMLTASVIPSSYLKKEKSPLSILNYPELKLKGVDYLESSKEPDLSVL